MLFQNKISASHIFANLLTCGLLEVESSYCFCTQPSEAVLPEHILNGMHARRVGAQSVDSTACHRAPELHCTLAKEQVNIANDLSTP